MKAIIREPKPCVLALNFADARLEALQSLCDSLSLPLRNYKASETPEAFTCALSDLLEGNVPAADALAPEMKMAMDAMAFPDELLYLANLPGDALDAFLAGIREQDLWISLKAVATPTNGSWKPMALRSELMEEHAAMQAAMEARRQQNDG